MFRLSTWQQPWLAANAKTVQPRSSPLAVAQCRLHIYSNIVRECNSDVRRDDHNFNTVYNAQCLRIQNLQFCLNGPLNWVSSFITMTLLVTWMPIFFATVHVAYSFLKLLYSVVFSIYRVCILKNRYLVQSKTS